MSPDQLPYSLIAARKLVVRKLTRQFSTASAAEIDDATSHAVVVLLRIAPHQVRDSSRESFLWLTVVASRWLSRELRRKKIFTPIDELIVGENNVEEIPDSYRADDQVTITILRASIEKIIGLYNTHIVWLKAWEGYQLNEIAQMLKISPKAVYHRYSKSVKRLRKFLPPRKFSKKQRFIGYVKRMLNWKGELLWPCDIVGV